MSCSYVLKTVGMQKGPPWPLPFSLALPVHVFAARALRLDSAKPALQLLQLLPDGRPPQILFALDVLLHSPRSV